jgi:hypothetical protein
MSDHRGDLPLRVHVVVVVDVATHSKILLSRICKRHQVGMKTEWNEYLFEYHFCLFSLIANK